MTISSVFWTGSCGILGDGGRGFARATHEGYIEVNKRISRNEEFGHGLIARCMVASTVNGPLNVKE
jgi:hypothetical protein